jgi:hypothetical protein
MLHKLEIVSYCYPQPGQILSASKVNLEKEKKIRRLIQLSILDQFINDPKPNRYTACGFVLTGSMGFTQEDGLIVN